VFVKRDSVPSVAIQRLRATKTTSLTMKTMSSPTLMLGVVMVII
jgi:hypothetical protein